uniref:Xrn1 N-terminal domain-containing protein n=1 Tax=viral metagenome TaxID=1070528 RepID=A0A6C0C606_9ZZZZ
MGIPSYFSFIVKNHGNIVRKINRLNKNVDNFYLDSNSIVYDCLRAIEKEYDGGDDVFEKMLIEAVCNKIDEYIEIIKPTNRVYIAFDGVAPVAKLEQQRNRRYKSYLLTFLKNKFEKQDDTWDKTAITPGTKFMDKLAKYTKHYYNKKEKAYNIQTFIVSTSDEPGEGEHKLFGYIRDNRKSHSNEVSMIYGLDADLIMLALNHLPISRQIYLYRETPEFIKSLNQELEPNEAYFLDIPKLAQIIRQDMNMSGTISKNQESNRLYDYIFLCFFLGNDFMPHFPSVNIRSGGIHMMLAAYKNLFGKTNKNLTNGKTIYWTNVKKLVEHFADTEHANLTNEYDLRNRWEKRFYSNKTVDDKMKRLDNIPTKDRTVEKFIDPSRDGWEHRYYKTLFNIDINSYWRKKICMNYLEGLEWTMKYYTTECCSWSWCYKYNYPPLWKDLVKYIPSWDTTMVEKNNSQPILPEIQLAYVLPRTSLKLLPTAFYDKLMSERKDNYPVDCKIHWSFCKYFWESHAELPLIDISDLEQIFSNSIK